MHVVDERKKIRADNRARRSLEPDRTAMITHVSIFWIVGFFCFCAVGFLFLNTCGVEVYVAFDMTLRVELSTWSSRAVRSCILVVMQLAGRVKRGGERSGACSRHV